jgi:hypothetical protein
VFGAEAKARAWLVLDGDTLYVDRNGNGDLTEANERVNRNGKKLEAGEVTAFTGKAKYAHLRVQPIVVEQEHLCMVSLEVRDKYRQYACMPFADRPQEAPVLWFDGPLTMGFIEPEKQTLRRGETGSQIDAWIGTPSPARQKDATVCLEHGQGIPSDIHPIASIEFPNHDPKGRPITMTVVLNERC